MNLFISLKLNLLKPYQSFNQAKNIIFYLFLQYTYNFEANFLNLSTKGILQGKIAGLIADVGLLIDLRNKTIKLTDLKLTKAK